MNETPRIEELERRLAEIRAEFQDAVEVARVRFDERMKALADEVAIAMPRSPAH